MFRGNVGAFYSQINFGSYNLNPIFSGTPIIIEPLVNRATLIIESGELSYVINPEVMPFINAGLIQVPQFSNSRPLVAASLINASLPQLSLNQNGFRLGAGVNFKHKRVTWRLEEKYYNSVGTFISYQTFLGIEVDLS